MASAKALPTQMSFESDRSSISGMPFSMLADTLQIGDGIYALNKSTGEIVFQKHSSKGATDTFSFFCCDGQGTRTTLPARKLDSVKLEGYTVAVSADKTHLLFTRKNVDNNNNNNVAITSTGSIELGNGRFVA
jgi:hypothetical protein